MTLTSATEVPTGTSGKVRVLLADDSEDVRTLLRLTLEREGLDVVAEAANGAEAVALTRAYEPDVLLLDVAMPVMDGLEALQEVVRLTPGVAVVMHSGFSEGSLAQRCLAAGAVAYAEKGMEATPLARLIRKAAVGVTAGQPAPTAARQLVPPLRKVPAVARPSRDPWLLLLPATTAVAGAVVLFACVFALRLSVGREDAAAVSALYLIPIALLAGRFGVRGGVVASAAAATLLAAYVVLAGQGQVFAVGVAARGLAFLVIGVSLGAYADRVRRLLDYEKRATEAIVSANHQLAEALERSRSSVVALEAANEDLRQFGYIVSHDLAEPLRSMAGFGSLLESDYHEQLDDRGLQYLGFIRDGAVRMRALIDDLRSYTDAGQQDLVPRPVDLDTLLASVVQSLSARLAERSAVVEGEDLPVVVGDRSLLALVLQNLVSNGIKFNTSDEPRVRLTRAEATEGFVAVDVADNGIGIPVEHADRVFGLFARLHTRDDYPGTGLGLAISRRVMQRHGGRIEVLPTTSGTTFRLTWPALAGPATTEESS